jgi:iron(III) transport system ATP-binding protein
MRVSSVAKSYRRSDGAEVRAIDHVSFDVAAGEFLVLLGPSGCGKTTLLRSMAGLERPDSGRIEIDGSVVFDSTSRKLVPPERRAASMMFQAYALWPHMSVAANVAYPLLSKRGGRYRGKAGKELLREEVLKVLSRVQCEHLVDQYPGNISGGQQQRVALARALVSNEPVIFFDEPLSNVDAKVRQELRAELIILQREIGFSAIYVTHDQSEALSLADRVAVLENGRIAQLGTPEEIYANPASQYVARFVGTVNEIPGVLRVAPTGSHVESPAGPVHVADSDQTSGGDVVAFFRPESCEISATPITANAKNVWAGRVIAVSFAGDHYEYLVDIGHSLQLRIWANNRRSVTLDENVWVYVDPADVRVLAHTESDQP